MGSSIKVGVAALVLIAAFSACAKSSDTSSASSGASPESMAAASAAPAESAAAASEAPASAAPAGGASAGDGAKVYQTNCSSCHQAQGQGVPGTFPPLAGNAMVTGDATAVIHAVKYGLNGKVTVGTTDYNGMMPAWGQQLTNADIASVITYVRSSWGNKGSAVTEADVAAVKQ
jgi:mono/diheme cytochrome c family protein